MRNPLLDLEFLRKLDLMRDKATYAKIILLTWDEEPVYEIQGKITQGSINIDGASAVRRTCSLTMVSPDVDVTNTYWSLKNKFKLEVGVENKVDSQYPEIIWFKQGIYVFTSLNMNVQSNNFTIAINGKDKMCLLNGEVGGSINVSTDFGQLEEYETLESGEIIRNITKIPIVDIIKNLLHAYGEEPLNNIMINDVDQYGLELLEYRGNSSLFLLRNSISGEVENMIFDAGQKYYLEDGTEIYVSNAKNEKEEAPLIVYYDRTKLYDKDATKVWANQNGASLNETPYNIIKIVFGETAGYRQTELTYPGELVANVGETVVSVLDKIKNMFSDFEYFYDIDGKFVFQKKQNYLNTSWNNIKERDEEIYAENALYDSSASYSFENGILLSAFTDAPAILDIKNDYSIWGNRKSVSGTDLPVHMRYAIDHKPKYYKPIRFIITYEEIKLSEATYERNKYYLYEEGEYVLATKKFRDNWIYYEKKQIQDLSIEPMVSLEWEEDYYCLGKIDTFVNGKKYYIKTESGYEQALSHQDDMIYYAKYMKYDWRELIYQMALDYFKYGYTNPNYSYYIAQANSEYYPTGITGYETYYTDMQGFWRELYHPGTLSGDILDGYYNCFTESELKNAAKELILRERAFIEEENITNLIINYIYDNYEIFKDDVKNETKQLIQWDSSTALFKILDIELNFLYAAHQKKYYSDWVAAQSIGTEQLMRIIVNVLDSSTDTKDEFKSAVKEMIDQQLYKEGYDFSDELIEYIYDNYDAYRNNEEAFFDYNSKQIIVNNSHIQYLLDMRAEKIKEMGKTDFILDNTTLVLAIIQTLEEVGSGSSLANPIKFKDKIQEKLESIYEDLDKSEIDFTKKILEYFSENKKRWFKPNVETDKQPEEGYLYEIVNDTILIKDTYLKYLLTLRQEKITETKDVNFYPNNDQLMSIIDMVIQQEAVSGRNFISRVQARIDGYYRAEIDSEYDLSDEIINYIATNYLMKDTMFNQISETKVEIKNAYLAQMFEQRQEKLKTVNQSSKWLSNELLLTIIFDVIDDETVNSGEEFKKIMEIEISVDEADIMQQILNRICNSQTDYDKLRDVGGNNTKAEGLLIVTDTQKPSQVTSTNWKPIIEINKAEYPYFDYLFAKRYEKMQRLNDTTNITNTEVLEIFYELFNTHSSPKSFLQGWEEALQNRE